MGFIRKIGNAFARFMYGRNGGDQLGLFMLWVAIMLDIVYIFVKNDVVYGIISIASAVLLLVTVLRMLSKNLAKRRAENAKFLQWFRPMQRKVKNLRVRMKDKEHRYFKCPNCKQQMRVPRGKGRITVHFRSCGATFEEKS